MHDTFECVCVTFYSVVIFFFYFNHNRNRITPDRIIFRIIKIFRKGKPCCSMHIQKYISVCICVVTIDVVSHWNKFYYKLQSLSKTTNIIWDVYLCVYPPRGYFYFHCKRQGLQIFYYFSIKTSSCFRFKIVFISKNVRVVFYLKYRFFQRFKCLYFKKC